MGPLIELELPEKSDTIPEGLKISPTHFLSVPEDERFRNILEEDNHEHHIVKISEGNDGKLSMKKIGSFTRVTDNFCFGTEDLETFCFLTITGDPDCTHGVSTTTAIIQRPGKCPHEDGALDSFVLCKSKLSEFQKSHDGNIKILDCNTERYHKLDQKSKYKMKITTLSVNEGDNSNNNSVTFNFTNLCKSNGKHFLGNYPRIIEGKNCKNDLKISLMLMELDNNEWDLKLSTIETIECCQHMEKCKFFHQGIRRSEQDNLSDSKHRNNSNSNTVVNIHVENVESIGSIAGQGNKNQIESIKDQSKEDSCHQDSDRKEATSNVEKSGVSSSKQEVSCTAHVSSKDLIIAFLVIVIALLLYKLTVFMY